MTSGVFDFVFGREKKSRAAFALPIFLQVCSRHRRVVFTVGLSRQVERKAFEQVGGRFWAHPLAPQINQPGECKLQIVAFHQRLAASGFAT